MELAGLSCAHAIAKEFPIQENNKALILVGPGNNGGDGLVLARHLSLMKFKPSIYYPKRTDKPLYYNLVNQCEKYGIEFLSECPENANDYRLIADALFGFSFKPPIRETFSDIMELLYSTKAPICAVDIPSGWDVEKGSSEDGKFIKPYMIISLTAPKLCAKNFTGIHYLGGRFIPPALAEKYQLDLPEYEGTEQCLKLN
jgi:NAD(P)H-hydrate epimerase